MGGLQETFRLVVGAGLLFAAVYVTFSFAYRAPEPPVSIGIEFPPKDQSRLSPPLSEEEGWFGNTFRTRWVAI